MRLPLSFQNSRWSRRKFVWMYTRTILVIGFIYITGMALLNYMHVDFFHSTLLLIPILTPAILLFIIAPNKSFDYDEYRTYRGVSGRLIDTLVIAIASTVCVPLGIAIRNLWLSELVILLVAFMVAVNAGNVVFVLRNKAFFQDGANPWFTSPMLPW